MKKKLSVIALFALACMISTSLMACSDTQSSSQVPVAVAIVIGNHANSQAPNLASPEIEKKVLAATSGYGFVSIVSVDGNPQLVGGYLINQPPADLAKSKLDQIATDQAHSILANLASVKASSPEVDTLTSLYIAWRSLSSAPQGSSKQIVVLDSGLSTTGPLNFQKTDFLNSDPNAVADYLNGLKDIPDFSGVTFTWLGLGDVAAPQQALSAAQRANLKAIWTAIIEKTGGKVSFLDTLSGCDIPAKDYPTVSTVSLLNDPTPTFNDTGPVVFRNIQFIGDTAKYINPAEAATILKPVAAYLKATPDFAVLLIGSTAGGKDKNYCLRLSSDRANAVRDTLIALGASANQIQAIGVGFEDPWHVPDTRPDGTLIESFATQNRKVVLLDFNSAEAKSILNETQMDASSRK